MKNYKKLLMIIAGMPFTYGTAVHAEELPTVSFPKSTMTGIGEEEGVMRRDPSDVIKVGDLFYVWYTKGDISPGYDGTVWYATSKDGKQWEEKGMALDQGKKGSWEGASVFTPNILVANDKYYLFYTGTSREYKKPFNPDSKIGVAVSDSPDGPWVRGTQNPVISNSANKEDFDSHLIDDACLIKRDGKYWMYYKGRQLGKSPQETKMGVAFADKPEGPYTKYENNPVIPGCHEVLIYPVGKGVEAMIGPRAPKELQHSVLHSEDGLSFKKVVEYSGRGHNHIPWAGGAYRPEAFTDSGTGQRVEWGVEIAVAKKSLPFIGRFDVQWPEEK